MEGGGNISLLCSHFISLLKNPPPAMNLQRSSSGDEVVVYDFLSLCFTSGHSKASQLHKKLKLIPKKVNSLSSAH
jgi:hypothetical protein